MCIITLLALKTLAALAGDTSRSTPGQATLAPGNGDERHLQGAFNYRLSRARSVVESAFGILAQRGRILRRLFRANDNTHRLFPACIAIHNFFLEECESSSAYGPPCICGPGGLVKPTGSGQLEVGGHKLHWADRAPSLWMPFNQACQFDIS